MVEFVNANNGAKVAVNPDHVVWMEQADSGLGKMVCLYLGGTVQLYVKEPFEQVVGKLRGWQEQVLQGLYGSGEQLEDK